MPEPTETTLTHIDAEGRARMVDVSAKPDTARTAVAEARVLVGEAAFAQLKRNDLAKGNALAQIAGIQGAKETSRLIPLCHRLDVEDVAVELNLEEESAAVRVVAMVKTTGPTGVEMEALTAASIASLTVYDLCKSVARDAVVTDIRLLAKTGGQSGDYHRSPSKVQD